MMLPSNYSVLTVMKTFTFSEHNFAVTTLKLHYTAVTLTNFSLCAGASDIQETKKKPLENTAVHHPRCL